MTGRSGWRLRLLLQMSARKGVSPRGPIYLTRPPEERWGSKAGNWLQETGITRFWRSWWSSPWLPAVWWDVRGSPWQCGRVPPTNHRPNTKFGSGTRLQWSPRWRHGCQLRTGVVQAGLLAALLSYNGAPSLPRQSGYCHSGTRRTMVATQGSVDGCPRGRHLVGLSWRHSSGPSFNMTWSRFRFLANARAASTAAWTQGPFPPTPSWSGCKSEIAPPHSLIAAYLFIWSTNLYIFVWLYRFVSAICWYIIICSISLYNFFIILAYPPLKI